MIEGERCAVLLTHREKGPPPTWESLRGLCREDTWNLNWDLKYEQDYRAYKGDQERMCAGNGIPGREERRSSGVGKPQDPSGPLDSKAERVHGAFLGAFYKRHLFGMKLYSAYKCS